MKRYGLYILILAVFIVISFLINRTRIINETYHIAKSITATHFESNLLIRTWNASHGGVYVPITKTTQPNPYLEVDNREITIDSLGIRLTKLNPAYMTRQVHEIGKNKFIAFFTDQIMGPGLVMGLACCGWF